MQTFATQVGSERAVNYDTCSLQYLPIGDFLVLGGSGGQLWLHSRDGIPLGMVCQCDGWILATSAKPRSQMVVRRLQLALHISQMRSADGGKMPVGTRWWAAPMARLLAISCCSRLCTACTRSATRTERT